MEDRLKIEDKIILAIMESLNCSESTAEKQLNIQLDRLSELYIHGYGELTEMDLEQSCSRLGISYEYTDILWHLIR